MSVVVKKIGELYRDLVTKDLKRRLSESSDVFMLNYLKLKSAEMTQLRKELKTAGASLLVTKNSFMRKVFEDLKKPAEFVAMIDGPMAFVFVKDDPISVSKVLVRFAKDHEALAIRGGFLAQRAISIDDVRFISKLSSKKTVYQQIASTLHAPIGKLAVSLNQIITKLAYALKAVKDKKGK